MTRCGYCDADVAGMFCGPNCEKRYNEHERSEKRYVWLLFVGILISIFIALSPIFGFPVAYIGLGIALLGLTVTALPFAISYTIHLFGVKKSVMICRSIGTIAMIFGSVIVAVSWLL